MDKEQGIKRLSTLNVGDRGIVANLVGKGAIIKRLVEMGLVRGEEVKVRDKSPLGDPIEVEVKGYRLSLRKDEADHVFVEVVD
ncbi:MAG: ferrous iron transport protein A [Thermoproteota archaeon]|nr:MAG: ferrous iron transport protein A [Candidatus Korarchaeota archaeon]